jgi:hypothetical protein
MPLFSPQPERCQVPVRHRRGCPRRAALDLFMWFQFLGGSQTHGRTYDGPVSCARNTKRITLYFPSRPLTQLGQPNPIHRILTLMTTLPAQIQTRHKHIVVVDGAQVRKGSSGRRACEPLVERPGTAGDREISRCVLEGRDEREPRCQFVCVVSDEERAGLEVGYDAGSVIRRVLRRIERVDLQCGARVFGVVVPGSTCPEVDAVAMVALGDKNVREETVSASVGLRAYVKAGAGDLTYPRSKKPPGGCGQSFQGALCPRV